MTMENMGELTDQQINDSSTTPITSSQTVSEDEFTVTPKQEFVDPGSVDSASVSPGVGESTPSGELPSSELTSGEIDSPASITRSDIVIPVSMIDSHEYRSQMGDLTYQTLNGRMSPSYSPNNYATLTPLQPLPPISTVSDKFLQNQNNFQLMNNAINGIPGMDNVMNLNTYSYDKMMNTMTPVSLPMVSMVGQVNGYSNQSIGVGYTYNVGQNGVPSPKSGVEMKPILSPNHSTAYDPYQQNLVSAPSRIHSPMKIKQCDSPIPMMQSANGLHLSPSTGMESTSPHSMHSGSPQHQGLDQNGKEVEEINTKELAQRISSELKRYSIPQAVFAQRVLCRSQGTLSDLLRNPKPWSKLKSGRETFRRMWKWLQEPEFQRMSALRLAACLQPQEPEGQGEDYNPYNGWSDGVPYPNDVKIEVKYEIDSDPGSPANSVISNGSTLGSVKRKESEMSTPQENRGPKKPRLVFTDIQRRTLHAIFKETKRPSKEMQATIAQQLGLEVTTVANFFMNARRRSVDKWRDDNGNDNRESAPTGMPKS
ncbi:hepatocyte nuclear factor 6-like isoform X3 [Ruditapes philippinarum]|uniref:hepatocyte nuclear factor 6-like isoform X3 n=1 Tax=Ruditapes philippinarum TaxID=129788 RepID=UPI00295AD2ED|nr:hepatocyte nuclear factor 6-like isoform X3 [Ruditapes philippinarum]